MKTSILYYGAFALVVLSSLVLGLDWQPATLSQMPPIKVVALTPPPPPPAPAVVAAPQPPAPIAPPIPVTPEPPPPVVAAPPPVVRTPPKPRCDVSACAAAYRSFTESDCTYQPLDGPRRLCSKGVPPAQASATPDTPPIANPQPAGNPPSNAQCNVAACAAAFRSFTASDCTFQPFEGPRQLCTK